MTTQDNTPEWVRNIQAPGSIPGKITIDGQEYVYTIIDNQVEQDKMPYVVGFTQDGFLMISQKVPVFERPFILAHEVREKIKFSNLPEEQRCLAALQEELKDYNKAYPAEYDNYLLRRFDFFTALVNYYQQPSQEATVSIGFRQGILAARDYLQVLSASRS